MAAMNFPDTPTVGQTFRPDGITYTWDGVKWTSSSVGMGGDVVAGSVSISPNQVGAALPLSRLGLNLQMSTSGWSYLDNGPGAAMLLFSSGPFGAGSRLNIGLADINTAGPGAPVTLEGVLNIVYGPQGAPSNQAFVVVGQVGNIPASPPPFATLFANQMAIEPGQYGASPTHSNLGFNLYVNNAGIQTHIGDGPAALVSMNPTNPHGSPMSRLTVAISDISTTGATEPAVGLLNLVYGPQGGGAGNAYVVIGDGSRLPSFQPPQDSLLCDELFLKFQQVLIGPANSGPGGTGRALYLA